MRIPVFPAGALIALLVATNLAAQSERPEEQVNPLAGNAQAIAAGQALYTRTCAVCHGQGAQGDRGPSLVSGAWAHGGADGEIFLSSRAGVRGTQMPAFAQFTADQIWQIVAYIRSMNHEEPQSATPVRSDEIEPHPTLHQRVSGATK